MCIPSRHPLPNSRNVHEHRHFAIIVIKAVASSSFMVHRESHAHFPRLLSRRSHKTTRTEPYQMLLPAPSTHALAFTITGREPDRKCSPMKLLAKPPFPLPSSPSFPFLTAYPIYPKRSLYLIPALFPATEGNSHSFECKNPSSPSPSSES